jgi:hypothetical protein
MTDVLDTTTTPRKALPTGSYSLTDLVRSEWTKLKSVRSTMWTLLATVVVGIGIGALATGETRAHWTPDNAIGFDPTGLSLTGAFFGQLTIGILGVLVMSSEYSTGTIRATFAASPKRIKVLVAKVLVFGLTVLVLSEAVSFISFFVGQALLTAPAFHSTLSSPGALRAVVGAGIYLCLMGLFALGLATIIRHTAGAISAYIGVLLVVPIIVNALPRSITQHLVKFLPDHIGAAIVSINVDNALPPWTGILALAGYAAVLLIIGGLLLNRRDA